MKVMMWRILSDLFSHFFFYFLHLILFLLLYDLLLNFLRYRISISLNKIIYDQDMQDYGQEQWETVNTNHEDSWCNDSE